MGRRILVLIATLVGMVALASPAHAQYEATCGFILDPPVVPVGGQVHIVGSQFGPSQTVTFFINGVPLGTVTSDPDSDGNIDVTFTLPPEFQTDGEFTITVDCPGGGIASNVLIVGQGVRPPPPVTTLPVTGSNSTLPLVQAALVLIAAGGLILLALRRRDKPRAEV